MKFCIRERIDDKRNISSGYIGSQLAGQQPGIRTCDVDISMEFYPQRVDGFFPAMNFLDFIKK